MKLSTPLFAALAAVSSTASADVTVVGSGPTVQSCHAVAATEATSYANVERDRFDWPNCLLDFGDIWMDQVDPSHAYWAGGDTGGHAVLVFHNKVTDNGKLLVFLAGTPASTKTYRAFGERAARDGYHAIVLPYWNASPGDDDATIQFPGPNNWGSDPYKCNDVAFPRVPDACYSSLYQYSTAGVPLPAIDLLSLVGPSMYSPPGGGGGAPEDGVEHRLHVTLAFLAANFPSQGWSTFVASGGDPMWSRIVLSGHSHGTANIANLSHDRAVHAVIFLEGPNDYLGTVDNPSSPTYLDPGATVGSQMWILDNKSDASRLPRVTKNIDALHLGTVGSSGLAIDSSTNFTNVTAHRLWAHTADPNDSHDLGAPSSCDPHMSTGTGCSGYFNNAWDYLLGQAAK